MSQEKAAEIIDLAASRDAGGGGESETAGEFLAAARRAAGLSLAAVSDATKVKIDHLEAIEASNRRALPAAPYAVGFVKVYARFLGLDADAVAKQFKNEIGADAPPPVEEKSRANASAHIGEGARMVSIFGIIAILIFVGWITVQITGNGSNENTRSTTAAPEQRVRLGSAPALAPTPRPRAATAGENSLIESAPGEIAEEPAAEAAAVSQEDVRETTVPELAQEETSAIQTEPEAAAVAVEEEELTAPVEISPAAALNIEQLEEMPALESESERQTIAPARREEPARIAAPEPVTVEARLVRSIAPRYPDRCSRDAAGLETVTVMFDVTAQGRPTNARVIDSSNSCFDEMAVSSIRRWRFDPKTIDGAPRPDIGKQATLNFRQ